MAGAGASLGQLLLLSPQEDAELRWFLYPQEALQALAGSPPEPRERALFTPKVYTAPLEKEEAAASAAGAEAEDEQWGWDDDEGGDGLFGMGGLADEYAADEDVVPSAWQFAEPPKALFKKTLQAVLEHEMIQDGDKIMLGVSGGKDSLTMVHVLHHLTKR